MVNTAASKDNTSNIGVDVKTNLAIVGAGLVGKRHADAISQIDHTNLSAIVDTSVDGRDCAISHNVPWYETLSDLLSAENPDGVILATPTPLHVEQGLECITNRVPVMIEKPLANSAFEAKELVFLSEELGVPVIVGHHRRHNPLIQEAREIINNGKIGQIRAVHMQCWFYKPDQYFDIAPWRKLKGAGPISVNLVHDVDLMRHLCGEIVSVQAEATPSARGFENEDVAAAVLRFENGAIGTITVSDSIASPWSWEMTSKEYPIYPSTSESSYYIGGTLGSLSVPNLMLWTHQEQPDWWTPIAGKHLPSQVSDPLINQIDHFAAVIAGNESPLVSGREGLRTLQVIEAIQIAAKKKECIQIRDLFET
ncbi:Gfo/Idh/MocA family protein [Rhodobacteraceae bacterium nBUS_22]|jgi:predicted dehydrogenase